MPSSLAEFVETYFSHIILGLLMCFGYLAWRVFSKPRRSEEGGAAGLEAALREAEAEARRAASARREGAADEVDGSGLALSPEQEMQREELRRLARKHGQKPESKDPEESQSGEEDK